MDDTVAGIDVGINNFRALIVGIPSTLLKDHIAHAHRPRVYPVRHGDCFCAMQVFAKEHPVLDRMI